MTVNHELVRISRWFIANEITVEEYREQIPHCFDMRRLPLAASTAIQATQTMNAEQLKGFAQAVILFGSNS